jgi:hypothetical protein
VALQTVQQASQASIVPVPDDVGIKN